MILIKIVKMCENSEVEKADLASASTLPQGDVASAARALVKYESKPRASDSDIPPKKRKTRRGKSKRKNTHPYGKTLPKSKHIKPEAPYNSNRFLIEDHGDLDKIDEELKKTDQASTSTVTRTRDSSVSVESDAEFYSTPDDEEVFLIKDFDNQYESVQAERLQAMSKDELIQEYLMLESKVEILSKRLQSKTNANACADLNEDSNSRNGTEGGEVQREMQRLTFENETLKRENESLRSKLNTSSDSADSETDSSDTCSSTTSSLSRSDSPVDYKQTNGHIENIQPV